MTKLPSNAGIVLRHCQANTALMNAIRADDVWRVNYALEDGADIHADNGYMLVLAQIHSKDWSDDSVVKLVADKMLGTEGFPIMLVMKELGYPPITLTEMVRNQFLGSPNNALFVDIPSDLG